MVSSTAGCLDVCFFLFIIPRIFISLTSLTSLTSFTLQPCTNKIRFSLFNEKVILLSGKSFKSVARWKVATHLTSLIGNSENNGKNQKRSTFDQMLSVCLLKYIIIHISHLSHKKVAIPQVSIKASHGK